MSRPRVRRRVPRTRRRAAVSAARGFTLLELLVVLVIIGIITAGAILSLGSTGRDRGLEQERDRLTALIAYVRDRGDMMSTEYGILCGQHGYRFVYYDNQSMQWLPETLDDTLRERRLPKGLDLQLVIEGRPIVLDDAALKINTTPGAATALGGASALTGDAATAAGAAGSEVGAAAAGFGPAAGGTATGTDPTMPADAPAVQTNRPQILLLSNGDTNSFQLTIERPSTRRSVTFKSATDGTISAGDIVEARQ